MGVISTSPSRRALTALARPHVVLAGGTDLPARVGRAIGEDVLDSAPSRPARHHGRWFGLGLGATTPGASFAADLPPLFDEPEAGCPGSGRPADPERRHARRNLCNASPAADGVPACWPSTRKSNCAGRPPPPAAQPIHHRRAPDRLAPGELAVAIHVPRPGQEARSAFLKLGTRRYL